MQLVLACLDDAKAEDTTVIDLHGKTSIAERMVIASGRSTPAMVVLKFTAARLDVISDRVLRALKEQDASRARTEGLANGDWVLIDAGDVIVHIFRPEVRQFYNLEKMWGADRPLAV